MPTFKDLPLLEFETQAEWEHWLAQHHGDEAGVWLRFYKKDSGRKTFVYAEALDVALCYGWIDSQMQKYDELSYVQKFTPRRKGSPWSKVNRDKVAKLIAAGRMQPPGLREIEAAQADGRWDAAYDSQKNMRVPDDLQQLLEQHPDALAFFESLNQANRYAFLYRIQNAKKPETRNRWLQRSLEMLLKREKFH
ncbi:MAG TPA: YdeI/OmpD-associated family protein [Candidatus Obscuribacterales bacterium]